MYRKILVLAILSVTAAPIASAHAEILKRKPGLWQMTETWEKRWRDGRAESKRETSQLCTDTEFDRLLYEYDPCESTFLTALAVDTARDVDCKGPVLEMKVHGRTRYQGDSAFHTDGKVIFGGGEMEGTETSDGKWVGACPAGAQPGDLMPASGVMVHLRKMMGK
jgi:hypothetical protein